MWNANIYRSLSQLNQLRVWANCPFEEFFVAPKPSHCRVQWWHNWASTPHHSCALPESQIHGNLGPWNQQKWHYNHKSLIYYDNNNNQQLLYNPVNKLKSDAHKLSWSWVEVEASFSTSLCHLDQDLSGPHLPNPLGPLGVMPGSEAQAQDGEVSVARIWKSIGNP